jgi:uncharacterized protein
MKLTLDANAQVNLIRSYSNHELRVGEQVFHRSCILTPDAIFPDWRPTKVEDLQPTDFDALFATKPQLVLLGTGDRQQFPPAPIRAAFARAGIGLETMDLGAACRTFNVLVQEERNVSAALLFGPG